MKKIKKMTDYSKKSVIKQLYDIAVGYNKLKDELSELHKAIRNSLIEVAVNVDKNIKAIGEIQKTVLPHTDSLKNLSERITDLEGFVLTLQKKEMKNEKR